MVGPQSGVQRAARELVRALDRLAAEGGVSFTPILLCPKDAVPPPLRATEVRHLPGRGQVFEQVLLPFAARGGILLNLANVAPILHKRSVLMMHDAQTRTSPDSYARAFRYWYAVLQPIVARRALRVLTVSTYSAMQLSRHRLAGRSGAHVIPNGAEHVLEPLADDAVLTRIGLRPGGYVLALGSNQPHKNVRMLLNAARLPGTPPLVLTGHAGAEGSLPGLFYAGRVDDAELRALYEGAIALALPSLEEGFGLPAGEAMACGCPVLAARAGALPEVLGGAGVLLPPDDPQAWAAAMVRLASDPGACATLSAAGLARAGTLSWRAAATELVEVIEEVTAGQAAPMVCPTYPSRRPSATPAR